MAVAALMGVACGGSSIYRVDSKFTPAQSASQPLCKGAGEATEVPTLPVADQVLGDIIVRCKDGCPREHAISALLFEAHEADAAHVSSLACVHDEADWECVARLSAPEHCEEAGR